MKCHTLTIADIRDLYKRGQIELNPPYQRKPVWKAKQRELLLSSLFNGIPIPAIILYKHFNNDKLKDIYDVLDGKQRLETILHFINVKEIKDDAELKVEFENPHNNKKDDLSFEELRKRKTSKKYDQDLLSNFFRYAIPVIEYEGDIKDIFGRNVAAKEVFVRINSTGSPLKKNEIRHSLWSGPFFNLGEKLENKKIHKELFHDRWKIISKTDIDRYLFHEFILELCTACYYNDFTDRRIKLDKLLSDHKWTTKEILTIENKFNRIISWIKDIFPNDEIRHTRFKNKSDFYSLFVVLLKLLSKGYVTKDRKNNKIAGRFLLTFSKQVQSLDSKIKERVIQETRLNRFEKEIAPYVNATRQATDIKKNRETRDKFLMDVLGNGFFLKSKDTKRNFNRTVKDILWVELILKSTNGKNIKCPNPLKNRSCKKHLTYEDTQIDHRYPWSKGGKTKIENAQLFCSNCNSSKRDK